MLEKVESLLAPVRRRQRGQAVLRGGVYGLVGGTLLAGILVLLAWWSVPWPCLELAAAALVVSPVLGCLVPLCLSASWANAAAVVDRHYRLKDRATTALDFASQETLGEFHHVQLRDALQHLAEVEPAAVAPLWLPRSALYALAGWLLALGVVSIALLRPVPLAAGAAPPLDAVVAQAAVIEEQIRDIEAAAKAEQSAELHRLAEKLRQLAEELKQPGLDVCEAMAKISEMQAAIAAERAEFNLALVDTELHNLGGALTEAKPLEDAGKALLDAQLETAAKKFEDIKSPTFDPKEAKAASEQLQRTAKEMKSKGLHNLSKATEQVGQGVRGDKSRLQEGARDLAKELRQHERRKRINQLMAREEERLRECKNRCASRNLLKRNPPKNGSSSSPDGSSGSEGAGTSDRNGMARSKKEIKGIAGEGPSEVEMELTRDAPDQRGRQVNKKVLQKYRREVEAILDDEAIPLGHRQTIRRYFEMIRPSEGDKEPAPEK
jgi:hypothetical protein